MVSLYFLVTSVASLEAVNGASALAEGRDHVANRDRFATGIFGEGRGVAHGAVDEATQNVTDLAVDGASDALDATAASEALDGALRDGRGVGLEHLLDALAGATRLSLGHFVSFWV